MTAVASRELRNNTRRLLDRVEGGETLTITVNGRPVALLSPPRHRPTWVNRAAFVRGMVDHQADPALLRELCDLAPGSTDDLPL
jgi:prevent-host-death family protein